jgi:hypothetical protein
MPASSLCWLLGAEDGIFCRSDARDPKKIHPQASPHAVDSVDEP